MSASEPRTVETCELRLYDPTTGAGSPPDFTIGADQLLRAELDDGAQGEIGQAALSVDNDTGDLTNQPTRGQRLEFDATLVDGTTETATLLLQDVTVVEADGSPDRLDLQAVDYVPGVLSERATTATFVDRPISGSADAIVESLIDADADEIGTASVQSVSTTTDLDIDNEYLRPVIQELATRGDAVISSTATGLIFAPQGSLTNQFDLKDFDFFGDAQSVLLSDGYASRVLVNAGSGGADVGSQTTHDSTASVTEGSPLVRQLSLASGADDLAFVDLWIDAIGATGDLTVALQDQVDGSGSIAGGSTVVDLARTTRATASLTAGAWNRFEFPGHQLRSTAPAVIVRASNGADVDVGVRASDGTLAYRAFETADITAVASDQTAADTYRRKDHVITDAGVDTQAAAAALAQAELDARTAPPGELSLVAKSERLRDATAGDRIDVQYPDLRATEEYVITGRQRTYDGVRLRTDVTLETRRTL